MRSRRADHLRGAAERGAEGLRQVPRPHRVEAGAPRACRGHDRLHGGRARLDTLLRSFPSSTTSSTCATATASSRGSRPPRHRPRRARAHARLRPAARLRVGDGRLQRDVHLLHRPLRPRPGDEPPGGGDRGGRPPPGGAGGARGDPPGSERQLLLRSVEPAPASPSCSPPGPWRGLWRLRFLTSHPRNAVPGLFEAMRDLPTVCEQLHLPVQAGDDELLRRMRRMYSVDQYLEKIAAARATVPALALTTDIIVGFSGETEAEFLGTERLLRTVHFDVVHLQAYSVRPGTAAARRPRRRAAHGEEEAAQSSPRSPAPTSRCSATSPWSGGEIEILVESTTDDGRPFGRTRAGQDRPAARGLRRRRQALRGDGPHRQRVAADRGRRGRGGLIGGMGW